MLDLALLVACLLAMVPFFVGLSRGNTSSGCALALVTAAVALGSTFLFGLVGLVPATFAAGVCAVLLGRSKPAPAYQPRPRKKKRAECPECGESIARSAKVCRFCSAEVEGRLGASGSGRVPAPRRRPR